MEKSIESAVATIFSANNIAISVLFILCVFLGWLVVMARKDEREDRKTLLEAVNNNTKAVNDLRILLSANLGKPL
jgi:uncharacterized membrane protein